MSLSLTAAAHADVPETRTRDREPLFDAVMKPASPEPSSSGLAAAPPSTLFANRSVEISDSSYAPGLTPGCMDQLGDVMDAADDAIGAMGELDQISDMTLALSQNLATMALNGVPLTEHDVATFDALSARREAAHDRLADAVDDAEHAIRAFEAFGCLDELETDPARKEEYERAKRRVERAGEALALMAEGGGLTEAQQAEIDRDAKAIRDMLAGAGLVLSAPFWLPPALLWNAVTDRLSPMQ